ncbi:MAG: hypothetical protein AAB177_14555, partial [Nitrospirota bacterium]
MAQITGSTVIDWSTRSYELIDPEAHLATGIGRFVEIFTLLENDANMTNIIQTSTTFSATLNAGGQVTASGTGFGTDFFQVTSFNYSNTTTGEFIQWTGAIRDFGGQEFFSSFTTGNSIAGISETFIGTIIPDAATFTLPGSYTGTLTSLILMVGDTTTTLNGTFTLSGDISFANLAGTMTGISILSGTNTINMTGLSVDWSALSGGPDILSVADLLTTVGSQMSGNDTITYTNNSGAIMTFTGGAGADTFTINGPNADTLIGGLGNDTYVVGVGDTVVENLAEGTDTVQSALTYTLGANVENLTLTGAAAINGTGNGLNNILTGNSAANVLTGGLGNDTYVVGLGDTVVENLAEGTDTVQSALTYTLGANVENLTLTGALAINGTGNGLNNILTGNSAINILTGGLGNDIYVVGVGDTVVENLAEGTDTVQSALTYTLGANVENLTLT